MNNHPQTLSLLNTAARLADALELLDACHVAASDGQLETFNARGQAELAAMLREIAFVATEAARELDTPQQVEPQLRLIKRSSHSGESPLSADDAPGDDQHPFRLIVAEDDTSNPLYIVKQAGG